MRILLQFNWVAEPLFIYLNAGVSGYGTYESLQLWKRMEEHLSVQQVVLFLFWGTIFETIKNMLRRR